MDAAFKNFLFWASRFVGLDKAVLFMTLSRVIQSAGGLINLILISEYLTSEEQGYYYTFGSLIAIQIFFELGLNTIIVQFVAHEVAHLAYDENANSFIGDNFYLSRVADILRLLRKAFFYLAFFLFFILLFSGVVFFGKYGQSLTINWFYPWLTLCISTVIFFYLNPFIGFFQGLGNVVEISKLYFIQQLIVIPVVIISLYFGLGLWSLAISNIFSVLIFAYFLLSSRRLNVLKYISSVNINNTVNYFKEIFPFQWKIALSWISGYFIFQIFNPVLFAFEGAEVAGKMGITLVALNGVTAISMSWLSTKVQLFSNLISRRKFKYLDIVFKNTFNNQIKVTLVLLVVFNAIIYGLQIFKFDLANRFLGITYIVLLSIVTLVNQIINLWATYLRCHKQDPFFINSVVGGIFSLISTISFGYFFGVRGVIYGYLGLTILIGLPWAYYVYNSKKREWHAQL
jgi:O-antigen/teichoic acid export membrane protein